MKAGAMRVLAVVGLLGVLAAGFAGRGVAAGAVPDGYCTSDGKPVVTYWPPGWNAQDWKISCEGGTLLLSGTDVLPPTSSNMVSLKEPPDFGRWVDILLNDAWLVNPYRDVDAFVVKSTGRTLIPLRYVSEAFGANVQWNQATRTARIVWQQREIEVTIEQEMALVNGHEFVLDQPAILWQDRTLVPLRFVVEAFGATVDWNDSASTVVITLPGVECAPSYCRK